MAAPTIPPVTSTPVPTADLASLPVTPPTAFPAIPTVKKSMTPTAKPPLIALFFVSVNHSSSSKTCFTLSLVNCRFLRCISDLNSSEKYAVASIMPEAEPIPNRNPAAAPAAVPAPGTTEPAAAPVATDPAIAPYVVGAVTNLEKEPKASSNITEGFSQ